MLAGEFQNKPTMHIVIIIYAGWFNTQSTINDYTLFAALTYQSIEYS